MNKTSFGIYFRNIAIIFTLFAILPIVLGSLGFDGTLGSYMISVLCFFLLTIVGAKLILGEKRYVRFYTIVFIFEILLGLAHYLFFVDSTYFNTKGDASGAFWHEYLSVYDAIGRLNDARNLFGVFYWMGQEEFQVTHPDIWHIISWPFYFMGNKWLNYSALNVFCCLLVSMNILYLYRSYYKTDKNTELKIRYWTAFFPSFLLSGTVWRDPMGISLISIGIVFATLSKNTLERIVSCFVFGFFAYVQRTMYLLLAMVASIWGYICRIKSKSVKILMFVTGIIALYYVLGVTSETNNEDYNSVYVNSMSFLALPIKVVFGMIGPFPWTSFPALVDQNPAFAWQLQDYLMGTFQFGYLMCLFCKWKSVSFKNLDAMTVMGLGIMASGFLTKQLHIGYISEGVLFTLPWFFSQVSSAYNKYFRYSLVILLLLNTTVLVIGNVGISSLWR